MSAPQTDPFDQSTYQVRLDWGVAGAHAVAAGVDAVVVVDVVPVRPVVADRLADELTVPVVAGSLRNRRAVAEWIVAQQRARGDRFRVAIVPAGDVRADGSFRPAAEDLLGAGAVVSALGDLGIDHTSPEAATAGASFEGLRRAVVHLVRASAGGRELVASGRAEELAYVASLDADLTVPVHHPGSGWEGTVGP